MQRRLLVALALLGLLAVLAGCSSAGSIDLRAVNDTELADEASRALAEFPDEGPPGVENRKDVIAAAVRNGSTTTTGVEQPIQTDLPVLVNGSYYALSVAVVGESIGVSLGIQIDYNASNTTGTAIRYAELPAVDKEALQYLFPPRDGRRVPGTDFGLATVYSQAERAESVFFGPRSYEVIIYEGERYPITIADREAITIRTYRYEATEVAPNTTAYAQSLRERYTFTLRNLTTDQREIIEAAIGEDSYYAESDDGAFESLIDVFEARPAIKSDQAGGLWLVRYEGEVYLVKFFYGGFR